MWHASVSYHGRQPQPDLVRLARAQSILIGVGDPALGEWIDSTPKALHLRRRLNDREQLRVIVRDVRHTPEARARFEAMPRQCQALVPAFIIDEEVGAWS